MTKREQLIWAAGVLEGEGCFSSRQQGNKRYPTVSCGSTDEDVVRRVAKTFGVGHITCRPCGAGGFGTKPLWVWTASTRQARQVMALVLPFMGKRRTARIKGLLSVSVRPGNYRTAS